jgi:hypothetical protein
VDLQGTPPRPILNRPAPVIDGKYRKESAHHATKKCEAHSVYECSNKRDLVRFLHAAAFSPVPDTWIKAIRAGHFATWPGLTEELVRKHLPKKLVTVKGHLIQRRKNLRSTTKIIDTPVAITEDSTNQAPTQHPPPPTSKHTMYSPRQWMWATYMVTLQDDLRFFPAKDTNTS